MKNSYARFTSVKEIMQRDYRREDYLINTIFDDLDEEAKQKKRLLNNITKKLQEEINNINKKRAAAIRGL